MVNKRKKIYPEHRRGAYPERSRRVFVMMSGGVDSSVAAFLLAKNKNYNVVGCFIKGYNIDGCQEKDAEDARRVAGKIDIPFFVIDLEKEYKEKVVNYMIGGYKKGITPNPDVMCNKEIKFGLFLEKALKMGADYVATGHYVRLAPEFPISNFQFLKKRGKSLKNCEVKNSLKIKNYKLKIAKDANKDQSYFLWTLTQKQLKHCLFPIGNYTKSQIREIAKKAGLPTAGKKDSQGVCFLGMLKMGDFLKRFLPIKKGNIIMADGKKIGVHDGVWFYTIGQRNLGIANRKAYGSNQKPLYVFDKNVKKNELIVAEENNNSTLSKKEIELVDVNFINPDFISLIRANKRYKVLARIRYRQPLIKAVLNYKSSGVGCRLEFLNSQKFVAPGQSAVFYSSEGRLLGGGIIEVRR